MNIAFVKQKQVLFGGGEGYVRRLMKGCAARGHEVHLITAFWPENDFDFPVNVHTVPINRRSRRTGLFSFAESVRECVERGNFDCVFSLERTQSHHIWRAGEGVHRKWMERRALYEPAWKTWFNRHSAGQRAYLEMEEQTVAASRVIIANSHLVKRDIEEVYPDVRARIEVIHNGVDLNRFSPHGRRAARERICQENSMPKKTPLLLFAGSNWRRKGLLEVFHALQRIQQAVLLITGRDHPASWLRYARRLGVEDRIRFLPPINEVETYYRASDVLLIPSWYDPFPNVGIEALACGTPLVTSRFSGVCELIAENGSNGAVISLPSAIDELEAGISEQMGRMEQAGRADEVRASVESFSLGRNIDETLAVVEQSGE